MIYTSQPIHCLLIMFFIIDLDKEQAKVLHKKGKLKFL